MPYMPELQAMQQETVMTTTWQGYNHNAVIQDGEMYDCTNMSAREYPLLTQREKRGITSYDPEGATPVPLTAIHGRDQLVFIRGTQVFYNFIPVDGLTVSSAAGMLPKRIVSMGAYVCIFPDKMYFNTVNLTDKGSMERRLGLDSSLVSLSMCRGDGTDYDMTQIATGAEAPAEPTNGMLWLDQSGYNDVLRQYTASSGDWTEVATTYVKISGTDIGDGLNQYDVITISGLSVSSQSEHLEKQVSALNGQMIVYFCGDDYIVVAGLLSQAIGAGDLETATIRADRTVPDLDFVVESNNRLWGCKYGMVGGQIINEIRACKLGDFRNWDVFMGLSTDSYTASVGTDGPFTGAVAQKGYPVFFKENCIHRVSGQTPSSFGYTTTMCRGVQRGSWQSAVVVNEAIYYKSTRDVMMYDGSMPVSVSAQVPEMSEYGEAAAGAVGGRYYISMTDGDGYHRLMTYDTKTGLWHKHDDLYAMFGTVSDELYAIDREHNLLLTMLGSYGETEDDFDWSAEMGLFGTDYAAQKYLSRFNLRMQMTPGSYVRLWIMYDSDGEWHDEGEIRGRSTATFMLPVVPRRCDHLRLKLTGHGTVKLYSMARMLEIGGDG